MGHWLLGWVFAHHAHWFQQPAPEAGEKQGSIHTPTVIIRFFGQYLSFGQAGPSPCKVHAVPGKHHSSERDSTVSIQHQPHQKKHECCLGAKTCLGKPNQCHQAKAQGSENLLRSYPKGKALGAVTKLHYTEN